jgi:hypothetical protein
MEQREQNHVLHELCRVATEEDESQIKEIKESASGTGCAQNFKSRRNKGNKRKCLRHRLRTESETKNFLYFFNFCGTIKKNFRTIKESVGRKITVISVISALMPIPLRASRR